MASREHDVGQEQERLASKHDVVDPHDGVVGLQEALVGLKKGKVQGILRTN